MLFVLTGASHAGMWEPNPDRRYQLLVDGECSTVTAEQEAWARDLAAKFKSRGGLVTDFEVAPGCPTARLNVNDEPSDAHQIFRMQSTDRYLVVSVPDSHTDSFAVDFARKSILQFGGIWTTTAHPHPTGAFAVIVYSHKKLVYGLPVLDSDSNPAFTERSASWY